MFAQMSEHIPAVVGAAQDLRHARKAFTRAHICSAARQLFVEKGYAGTTMEQIGKLAGAPRSTLYNHFSDKEEILDVIAGDYIARLNEILVRVPCPHPTREEVRSWIGELAEYISEDRMPTVLFNGINSAIETPRAVKRIGESVMGVLASRLPAFAGAVSGDPEHLAVKAHAQVAVRELSLCCQSSAMLGGDALGACYLEAATDIFHRFVVDFADTRNHD